MSRIRCVPFFVVALFGLALGARPAAAQQIPSPYRYVETRQSFGVFGGYFATDQGKLDLGPESGPAGGLRYGIRLGGPFTAEATALFFPSTHAVFDTTTAEVTRPRVGEADIDLVFLGAALRFDLTGPRTYRGLMPYLIAGGGMAFDIAGDSPAETEIAPQARFDFGTRFAGQIGAGIEWFATRRFAIRADARDIFWSLKTPESFRDQNASDSQWVQNFMFSLGLGYHF